MANCDSVIFETFDCLPQEAKDIRTEVFVKEQGFETEFDEIDDSALHIVGYVGKTPVSTCRVFRDDSGTYHIGRIAVVKSFRGKSIGAMTVLEAESKISEMGGSRISLSAQTRVGKFYEKMGYIPSGDVYYEEFCPHIRMTKVLETCEK